MKLQEDILKIKKMMGILSEDSNDVTKRDFTKYIYNKLKKSSKLDYLEGLKMLTLSDDKGVIAILTPSAYADQPDLLIVNDKFILLLSRFVNLPYYPVVQTIHNFIIDEIKDEEYSKVFQKEDYVFEIVNI